jgi:hypothetical protein
MQLNMADDATITPVSQATLPDFPLYPMKASLVELREIMPGQVLHSVQGRVIGLSISSQEGLKTWLSARVLPDEFVMYIADQSDTMVSVNVNKDKVHAQAFSHLLKLVKHFVTGPPDKPQEMQALFFHNIDVKEVGGMSNQLLFTYYTSAHDVTDDADDLLDHEFGNVTPTFNVETGEITSRVYNFANNAA